jgi:hypothetical protein
MTCLLTHTFQETVVPSVPPSTPRSLTFALRWLIERPSVQNQFQLQQYLFWQLSRNRGQFFYA